MAAVDEFDAEPLTDARDPPLALDNVVRTPHIGYVERDALEAQFSEIFEQVLAYAAGRPINVVNPAALAAGAETG
jgi:D-3-phosphoglycerate dehydrogenase